MSKLKSDGSEPLMTIGVRVPGEMKSRLIAESKSRGVTISDIFRTYIDLADAKPLGKVRPQRRQKKMAEVSGCDPRLMRQLASVGNNLNQIAHALNYAGKARERISILCELSDIEQSIGAIARAEEFRARRELAKMPAAIRSMKD